MGSLFLVHNSADLDSLNNIGSLLSWTDPRIILLNGAMFNKYVIKIKESPSCLNIRAHYRATITRLRSYSFVAGALILTTNDKNRTRTTNAGTVQQLVRELDLNMLQASHVQIQASASLPTPNIPTRSGDCIRIQRSIGILV